MIADSQIDLPRVLAGSFLAGVEQHEEDQHPASDDVEHQKNGVQHGRSFPLVEEKTLTQASHTEPHDPGEFVGIQ